VRAVDDLTLRVPRRSLYGFLGPNGAGKTTTIRMLLGLTRPSRGQTRIFGELLTPASRRALLRRIGALVETPSLYPNLTGLENLRITQGLIGLDRSEVDRVLQIVRLDRDAHGPVQNYSHGMRQRLAIALALLPRPELLILDEPTNELDPAGIHETRDLIRTFPRDHGITVFLSSHLLAEIEQIASHVGVIGRGRLLFEGALTDLQRNHARTRVVIEVDRPDTALSVLRASGFIIGCGEGLELTADNPRREDVSRIAETLVCAGLRLYQLRWVKPSLEDLFLDLTRDAHLGSSTTEDVHT
jgi:ABC-2 type transport system ATP-binding protein